MSNMPQRRVEINWAEEEPVTVIPTAHIHVTDSCWFVSRFRNSGRFQLEVRLIRQSIANSETHPLDWGRHIHSAWVE